MNKKLSSLAPAYLDKVRKEILTKPKHPSADSIDHDSHHEKINFKQYLRNVKEQQNSDDEYWDIEELSVKALSKIGSDEVRVVGFKDQNLALDESSWEDILSLKKDDSITIHADDYANWYVSRSINNQIIFENHDDGISGKFSFDEFINKLK